ncbi:MAG: adenylate/guanylate cyclase domain-containing protein, partial [Acidimicrobiia bacterium]
MTCPNCGHENPAGAKYCAQCGHALPIICPVCSHQSPPDANFCSNCGHAFTDDATASADKDVAGLAATRYVPPEMREKIEEVRRTNPMRGERRTVTMLFADIKGSTAAAEGLDPEDWSDIINGAFEHMIAPVYRYEGTLARLMGDAVLAFFGAPIAHEDDPVRAVRAGLEIADAIGGYKTEIGRRWGIDIDVRVGINTGLVVVGEVGSDLRVEYTALGDAVNVAARMEQTAHPGTVQVTADTWRLVSDQFEGESIGGVEVKGKSEPVRSFRV